MKADRPMATQSTKESNASWLGAIDRRLQLALMGRASGRDPARRIFPLRTNGSRSSLRFVLMYVDLSAANLHTFRSAEERVRFLSSSCRRRGPPAAVRCERPFLRAYVLPFSWFRFQVPVQF